MDRHFAELSVDSFKGLIKDKNTKQRIELILSEYEYEKYSTLRVPTNITEHQMKDLLSLGDSEERKRWISYLFQREIAKNKTIAERKKASEEYWIKTNKKYETKNCERTGIWNNEGQLEYGLWHNTLFSKILRNSVNRYYSHRLRRAALFGTKLVIDLDYDNYMKLSECRQLARQIHLLYNWNRYKATEPFDLHFTNCDPNKPTLEAIHKQLPNSQKPGLFLADFHQKSYTDLFPKEKLVYLSPHSEVTLKEFNCDDIHIIGGIIDKSYHQPLSFIKAKKDGIRCAKLPIDDHIIWGSGSKSLCLNHILQILHDVNVTGDWNKALKDNIPTRKQKSVEQIEYEDMLRKQKYNRMKKKSEFDPKKANNYF